VLLERSPAAADVRLAWLAEFPPGSYSVSARDPTDVTQTLASRTAEFRMPVDLCKLSLP